MRHKATGPRALTAEFIGTLSLIFIGAGAATALGANHDPAVAFAHGLAIMVFIAAFGDISGCHINPAVTIGLAAPGEFPARRVVPYILAQLVGAIAAGYCLLYVFGGPVSNLGATVAIRTALPISARLRSKRWAPSSSSTRFCTPRCDAMRVGSRQWRSA